MVSPPSPLLMFAWDFQLPKIRSLNIGAAQVNSSEETRRDKKGTPRILTATKVGKYLFRISSVCWMRVNENDSEIDCFADPRHRLKVEEEQGDWR